jgi:hypothetical protein
MKKNGKMAIAGLFLVASAAYAQDGAPDAHAVPQPEGYKIIRVLGSEFSGGIYAKPCASNECSSPVIQLEEQTVSALLQSTKDGSLVQCFYEKVSSEPGTEVLFDEMRVRSFTGFDEGGLNAADLLRPPAAGQKSGSVEKGSCVPVETPFDISGLSADMFRDPGMGLAFRDESVSMGIGKTSIFFDRVREDRLIAEYRRVRGYDQRLFSWQDIDNDPEWRYFSANGAACPNTGDFKVAEDIMKHNEDGTIMPDVPLRGACPLMP